MSNLFHAYQRQMSLSDIGYEGQIILKHAKVLLIGLGGIGCPMALYLASAGIGYLGLMDDDKVEVSNLHRQPLFDRTSLGENKVIVAKDKLQALNPDAKIISYREAFDKDKAHLINDYDVIIDGTDNFETRYKANQACVKYNKPMLNVSVLDRCAQLGFFNLPSGGGCYNCVFEQSQQASQCPTCLEMGALGADIATLATVGASQVINFLLDLNCALFNRFYCYDARALRFDYFDYNKDPNCSVCQGKTHYQKKKANKTDALEIGYEDALLLSQTYSVQWIDMGNYPNSHHYSHLNAIKLSAEQLLAHHFEPAITTIVCCAHGISSKTVVALLKQRGVRSIYSLQGGFCAMSHKDHI